MQLTEWRSLLRLSWYSYKHAFFPLLFVLLAMLAASSGFTTVLKINQTAKNSYQSANQYLVSGVYFRIESRHSDQPLTKLDYAALRRDGFTKLVPILRSSQRISQKDDTNPRRIELVGIDIFALPASSFIQMSEGNGSSNNADPIPPFWQSPFSLIAHENLRDFLDTESTWFLTNGNELPQIHYIETQELANELILDIGALQSLLEVEHLTELLVVGNLNEAEQSRLEAALPSHLKLSSFRSGNDAQQLTGSFHLNLLAMGILMFVVCMFVVMNALHLLIQRRINHFRICRQLGVGRQQLFLSLAIEWIVVSIVMGLLGALLGSFLAQQLTPSVNQTLQGLYGVRVTYSTASYWQYAGITVAANVLGTLCALSLPLSQLNATLAKIRNSRGFVFRQQHHVWFIAAILLAIGAYLVAVSTQGLFFSFVVVALVLFCGCSLLIYFLPILLKGLFKLAPKSKVMLSWSLADSVGLSRSSKIACCAFFIAIATNVGMNLMIDSFRNATEQWLQQRLTASYYLYSEDPKEFFAALSNSNLDVRVVPRQTLLADFGDAKVRLNSYPTDKLYQDALAFEHSQESPWPGFVAGTHIFISQQTANHFDLSLGDKVIVSATFPSRKEAKLFERTVAAIYYDYGNTEKQMLLPQQVFDESVESRLYALHVKPGDRERFDDWYQSILPLNNTNVVGIEQLLITSMQTFDRTFIITGSLNIVTLAVAAISLITSFLLINQGSAATHSLIRSLGIPNLKLSIWILFQYSLIILLSCLMAIPFGIILSWLLINFINVQAFGWSYPMILSSISVFKLASASVGLLVIAMLIPTYIRAKKPILKELKWLS